MSKSKKDQNEKRDQVLEIRLDNLTESERYKMQEQTAKAKRKYAPDARGTFVGGSQNQLPGSEPKQLGE